MSNAAHTPTRSAHRPPRVERDDHQIRRDRITAIIVLGLTAALMVMVLWLANLGVEPTDYWPMMP